MGRYLRWHLTQPLLQQSKTGEVEVPKVTQLLDDYDLTREDFDSLMEIGQYQGRDNYMSKVRIYFLEILNLACCSSILESTVLVAYFEFCYH